MRLDPTIAHHKGKWTAEEDAKSLVNVIIRIPLALCFSTTQRILPIIMGYAILSCKQRVIYSRVAFL
jgi:hypothetical protein